MTTTTLDVREIPPQQRHPKIHSAFEELDAGESLTIINDHDPKPLFYEMQAEVDAFDADNYEVEQRDDDEFAATFPKQ
ncbi:MAG: DUF2249 domain-containing protein [Haloarculaceae archaeon]